MRWLKVSKAVLLLLLLLASRERVRQKMLDIILAANFALPNPNPTSKTSCSSMTCLSELRGKPETN